MPKERQLITVIVFGICRIVQEPVARVP